MTTTFYIPHSFLIELMILNRKQQEAKQDIHDKIMEIALKKNIKFAEAKKMLEAGQASLGDFRIR